MRKSLKQEIGKLLSEKKYLACVGLTMLLSYFFLWTHPSMGVDDTCVQRYFADGFAPTQGRSTLFLLNKIFHVAEFSPFIVDFLGVSFLVLSSVVLCAVFRKLSGNKIPLWALTGFSCSMISYPLIGEVFVYYLHNGIGLAYLLTALATAVLFLYRGRIRYVYAGLLMAAALSCYESFAMVYILCMALAMGIRLYEEEETKTGLSGYIKKMALLMLPLLAGMLARSVLTNLLCMLLGREPYMFSLSKAVRWIFSPEMGTHLRGMIGLLGRYYVVNGLANMGIAVYLLTALAFFVFTCVCAVRKRRPLWLLNGLLVLVSPWLLSVLEGTAIPYRSMQALPVFVGFTVMVLLCLAKKGGKLVYGLAAFGTLILVYNQAFQLNRLFYTDYLKYEEDLATSRELYYELAQDNALDKPVVFWGRLGENGTVRTYGYLDEDTLRYEWISQIRQSMGGNSENGYSIVQNFVWYNIFDWGTDAFEGRGTEILQFMKWHGYHLLQATEEMYKDAETYAVDMPCWPQEGSIRAMNEYVIVKLGDAD